MIDFDTFWRAYPAKKAKPVAQKAWAKIKPSEHAAVLAGVERAKRSRQWADGYVPHPATFLNQRRWEDEYEKPLRTAPVYEQLTDPRNETWEEAAARIEREYPELVSHLSARDHRVT